MGDDKTGMLEGRKYIDPTLLAKMDEQDKCGGIDLRNVMIGESIEFQTRNSLYTITRKDDKTWMLQGGTRWQEPAEVDISGSTHGGSVLKLDWVGEGMHVEIWDRTKSKMVTTSAVVKVRRK
jgi:hypothetical protein